VYTPLILSPALYRSAQFLLLPAERNQIIMAHSSTVIKGCENAALTKPNSIYAVSFIPVNFAEV